MENATSHSNNDRDESGVCNCYCHHCNSGSHGLCSFECHTEIKTECEVCDRVTCICGELEDEDEPEESTPYGHLSFDQIISRMKEIKL